MGKCQILLTNDDGIQSPGLWAAAEALSELGFVTVAAPRDQSSGMGRSLPSSSDGIIRTEVVQIRGKEWTVYAVGGSPAQAVLHGILEIMPQPPDLVVSGINYGENVATGITISGTVGAALEAASHGIPGLAMSLETDREHHFSLFQGYRLLRRGLLHRPSLPASCWRNIFRRMWMCLKWMFPAMPPGKRPGRLPGLPASATMCQFLRNGNPGMNRQGLIMRKLPLLGDEYKGSDVYVLRVQREVSVTPLSLDLTCKGGFRCAKPFAAQWYC